jgi:serpin B
MRIFLPRVGKTLDDLHGMLTPETWTAWSRRFGCESGRIVLPRFTVRTTVDLVPALSAMGMAGAFTDRADFSAMADGELFLTGARQQTLLEVNEEGTVAVAVTEMMLGAAMPMEPFEMVVDRPFLVAIVDVESGAIVFLGAIRDPSST